MDEQLIDVLVALLNTDRSKLVSNAKEPKTDRAGNTVANMPRYAQDALAMQGVPMPKMRSRADGGASAGGALGLPTPSPEFAQPKSPVVSGGDRRLNRMAEADKVKREEMLAELLARMVDTRRMQA